MYKLGDMLKTQELTNLDPFFAQEVGGGVQHVGGVRGVVVRVGRVVAGLHELQPGAQRRLRAVEELAHAEAREDLQAEVSQRSAEDHTRDQLTGQHILERRECQIYSICISS